MFTYKVVMANSTYEVIEADYFSMTFDGHAGMNAYFYVRKPIQQDMSRVRISDPEIYEEVLVGYANNPRTVSYTDKFVYQPSGNNATTDPIDKNPWAR
jgi:hypothetical protein